MQYIRAISPRNCTPFLRGTICPRSSQIKFFWEVLWKGCVALFLFLADFVALLGDFGRALL